jgi:hypothetical protein
MRFTLRHHTPVLSSARKSSNPARLPILHALCASSLCARGRLSRSGRGVKSFRSVSPALFTPSSSQYAKNDSLTPVFSVRDTRSFTLFLTLVEISPLFARSYEKYLEYPSARHKIGTIVPVAANKINCAARSCRFNRPWFDVRVEAKFVRGCGRPRNQPPIPTRGTPKPEETERCDS